MITNIYVIHDKCAKMYNKPFFQLNDSVAMRTAQDIVNTPNTDIYNTPSDFTMFKIGTYDDENAHINIDPDMPILVRFHELQQLSDTPAGPLIVPDQQSAAS